MKKELNISEKTNTDIISAEKIKELFQDKSPDIILLDTVDSTNEYIKHILPQNAPEKTVVIARTQTSGKGRFKRKFYSPDKSGIYMSVLLKPDFNLSDSVLITAAAAVAVSDACETLSGNATQIKWVNDVLIKGKKVCGILCEGVFNYDMSKLDRVILGIGINAYSPENGFAPEIKNIAGAVFDTESPDMRNRLIALVLDLFFSYYSRLSERTFFEKYRERSAVIGKNILVFKGANSLTAKAIGIDNDCRLLVEYANKKREYLSHGEVSIKL